MGMAASQGRLLYMTARLSDNEFEQQCVAHSKQQLADSTHAANDKYLDALNSTKYQILTGYNGTTPVYEDVTYNMLTGLNKVAVGKQYIVQDNKGKIIVTDKIANAFEKANGNYNYFLQYVGGLTQVAQTTVTEQDVHEAWDKYLVLSGNSNIDSTNKINKEHILGFGFKQEKNINGETVEYPTYNSAYLQLNNGEILNLYSSQDNNTKEQKYYYRNFELQPMLYQYENGETEYRAFFQTPEQVLSGEITFIDKVKVTYEDNEFIYSFEDNNGNHEYRGTAFVDAKNALDTNPKYTISEDTKAPVTEEDKEKIINEENPINYNGTDTAQRNLYDAAVALTKYYATYNSDNLKYDADEINYYKNIYNQMLEKGYTTYTEMIKTGYMSAEETDETVAFKDENWLLRQLKQGKLSISYYSIADEKFVGTSLDDDENISEKEDKKKIAIAEQEYQTMMDRIESQDKRFDMQLSKLEAEHNAIQTEYDSVVKVISKNVEKSFGTFNA